MRNELNDWTSTKPLVAIIAIRLQGRVGIYEVMPISEETG